MADWDDEIRYIEREAAETQARWDAEETCPACNGDGVCRGTGCWYCGGSGDAALPADLAARAA
jgi:DnaJ-class molecular chaperone